MERIKDDGDVTENQIRETQDPVLLMLGVGRYLWEQESGEKFIERVRSEDLPAPVFTSRP